MKTEKEIALDKAIAWYDSGSEDKEEFIKLMTELFEAVWSDGVGEGIEAERDNA